MSEKYTKDYHYTYFEAFCKRFEGYTEKCVISFLDLYDSTKRNTRELNLLPITKEDMVEIARNLVVISKKYDIIIETCSETIDLLKVGISKGKCIDDRLMERILGCKLNVKKDENQREECGCVKSIDIGQYNTCPHFCTYCYANHRHDQVLSNVKNHHIESNLLTGDLLGDEKITIRAMRSRKQ